MHVTAGCASTSFYTRRRGGVQTLSSSSSSSPSPSQPQNQAPNQARTNGSDSNHAIGDEALPGPVQDGEWECLWHGRADYLDNGLERDWSVSRRNDEVDMIGEGCRRSLTAVRQFKDVVLNDEGHVISVSPTRTFARPRILTGSTRSSAPRTKGTGNPTTHRTNYLSVSTRPTPNT
jgi:hypothetical protein